MSQNIDLFNQLVDQSMNKNIHRRIYELINCCINFIYRPTGKHLNLDVDMDRYSLMDEWVNQNYSMNKYILTHVIKICFISNLQQRTHANFTLDFVIKSQCMKDTNQDNFILLYQVIGVFAHT